ASVRHTTQQAAEFTYLVAKCHKCVEKQQLNLKWIPPKDNFYKLNTDGACTDTTTDTGGIIRNSKAEWILGFATAIPRDTSMSAELHALLLGLTLAHEHNLKPLEVEVDAKEVITMIQSNNVSFANILINCRYLLDRLGKPVVQHAYREQNRVADRLAKEVSNFGNNSVQHIFETIPDFVRQVFEEDKYEMLATTTVPDHVLTDLNIAPSKSDASTSGCKLTAVDNSNTRGLYNSILPSSSVLSSSRMQYMHQFSVRLT
ncbi:hypothetical protein A4A49_57124, partial [Nicotiana attenuata]